MKRISHIRKRLERTRKGQLSNVLWYLYGLATLPIFGVLASVILELPDKVIGVLIPLLFLLLLIQSTFLIFLLDKYAQAKRFIDKHHPGVNLDGLEEEAEEFNDETNDNETP